MRASTQRFVQTHVKSHNNFHQYFERFRHVQFKICFVHLVLLKMISFEKLFEKVAQKFGEQIALV